MRIEFQATSGAEADELKRHVNNTARLGLPSIGWAERSGALAIVGGGSSIAEHIQELKEWNGEICAINGAFRWCRERGINAAFFTVDPDITLAEMARGASRAYLATSCHPQVFEVLGRAEIQVFGIAPFGWSTGCTTATVGARLGPELGYRRTVFFGCESSYSLTGHSHAYTEANHWAWLRVRTADGLVHLTDGGLMLQAEMLAEVLRRAPGNFEEHCGGLLRSLVKDPHWDAVEVSHKLNDALVPIGPGQEKERPDERG